MTSSPLKRAWQPPAAMTLAVRRTAGLVGPGPDNFLKASPYYGPVSPAAPSAAVGAGPAPALPATGAAADADRRTWDAPLVTPLRV
jgi:hypothetical protein